MKEVIKGLTPPALWRMARYVKRRISPPTLFDGDSAMFTNALKNSSVYGEYGMGTSTDYVYAHTDAHIIAVESSPEWANSRLAGKDRSRATIKLVELGDIVEWGRPAGYSHSHNFDSYIKGIWQEALQPDLVLIDGRFRVGCFLTSLAHASPGTQIIFDDYADRPHYHIVERVLRPVETCGRQVRFERPENYDTELANDLLEKFRYVMD